MPLSQSIEAAPERERDSNHQVTDRMPSVSGRWSRSQHRQSSINDDHPSPLRTKLKKRTGTYRSTGRLVHREMDKVHGNRHVGGCCGHEKEKKPRVPH